MKCISDGINVDIQPHKNFTTTRLERLVATETRFFLFFVAFIFCLGLIGDRIETSRRMNGTYQQTQMGV
jgi:hypothetical protein